MWFSEGVAKFRPKNQLFLKNEDDVAPGKFVTGDPDLKR